MPVVAVVNRKGGSGKSTLATHLAAWCAHNGVPVMLGDVDKQQSTQTWLKLRAQQTTTNRSPIVGWAVDPRAVMRAPAGVSHVVLDTPGGMRGFELARVAVFADVIVMPVCNSVFDRDSAADCFAELMTLPRVASGRCQVAAIGMRLDARTKADEVLKEWAERQKLPFIGVLRETQGYVRCIERGLTLFDVPAAQVQADLAQWKPILHWLGPVLKPKPVVEKTTVAMKPTYAPKDVAKAAPKEAPRDAQHDVRVALTPRAPVRPVALPPVLIPPPSRPGMAQRVMGSLLQSLGVSRRLQR